MTDVFIDPKHVQGSEEWLAERRKHLGASDAAVVMGLSPWCTPFQLWERKLGLAPEQEENAAMRRGSELESLAREAFEKEVGVEVFPTCVYNEDVPFMMASLDGLNLDKSLAVEIKCPGAKAHAEAVAGNVPAHYMPQLQHQLACLNGGCSLGVPMIYYYSFDGEEGVLLEVQRDEDFIEKMILAEVKFWKCVTSGVPPEMTNKDYADRNENDLWIDARQALAVIDVETKELLRQKEYWRAKLIESADGRSCRGAGMCLTRSFVRGRVNYLNVPELEGVDLDQYRGPSKEQWTLRLGANKE